ncbi:MAG: PIG-L family deacetylase [Verrucomicrobiales bacterium]|nr:PIG-L family deacetylase [Verrucomicrobiales bacterium]
MKLLRKICERLTDPVFYRKRTRDLLRGFRNFEDGKPSRSLSQLGEVASAVIVVAHPDDEVFCSGLLCEMKDQDVHVRVLCLTKGEGGPCGDHPREALGRIRAEEMKEACDVLGVDELIFLGHIDPVGRGFKVFAPEISPVDLASQILPHLAGRDLVISHGSGGEYWHPAHLLVFEAVKDAVSRSGAAAPTWITFSARQPDHPLPELVNWDDPAFLTLEGSRHERKRLKALDCHRTQLGLFSKFASGDHADFIRLTSREAYALQQRGRSLASLKDPGNG